MTKLLAIGAAAIVLGACGAPPMAQPPSSASPSTHPTQSPAPSATPEVAEGATAYVSVSVATGWRTPQSPRPVDGPALENPARVEDWISGMTAADQVGLIDRVDTQAVLGDPVRVLKLQGGWAQVVIPDQATPLDQRGYPVWVPVRQLTAIPPPEPAETATVVEPTAELRPFDEGKSLRVSFGTELPVLGEDSGTYTVVVGARAWLVDKTAVSLQTLPATAASIVATARSFLGLKYLWGGTSGFGYDCSGFVYAVFKAHGILLPRDSDPQSRVGLAVSRTALQPGDLVFFSSGGVAYHVAIYAGQGLIIESPSPGHPVEQVTLSSFPGLADYSGARRVLAGSN